MIIEPLISTPLRPLRKRDRDRRRLVLACPRESGQPGQTALPTRT